MPPSVLVLGSLLLAALPGAPDPRATLALPVQRGASEQAAVEQVVAKPTLGKLPDAAGWRARVLRDARIAPAPDTATRALAVLLPDASDPWTPAAASGERAVAVYASAWAESDAARSRRRLAALVREPDPLVRRAAVLGLGETGAQAVSWLAPLLDEPELAGCAALALARAGGEALALVEERAAAGSQEARRALSFLADPLACEPFEAGALLYDLRWEAARRHGLVDGQVWRVTVMRALCADARFLRESVLGASGRLLAQAAADHLEEVLVEGEGEARLAAAVARIPDTVNDLVRFALWTPRDDAEWTALLDAVADARAEGRLSDVLERATQVEAVAMRARAMLAHAGRAVDLARDPQRSAGAAELVWWARAVADAHARGRSDELVRLESHERPPVRAAALVARARLEDQAAREKVAERLRASEDQERPLLVAELAQHAQDAWARALLEEILPAEEPGLALLVATGLAREGSALARARLRRALRRGEIEGRPLVATIALLARDGGPEDEELFRELWPIEGGREANTQLASALIELGDPTLLPVLREAIWTQGWPIGLLAAGLLAETKGLNALREELARAPARASSNDLRRVGFALGEWGGIGAVEELARRVRGNAADAALQGALLGALATRTY